MITTGVFLGFLSSTAFCLVALKLPGRAKRFIVKYALVTDGASTILTYMLLGGTLTGLIGASTNAVLISLVLYIARKNGGDAN